MPLRHPDNIEYYDHKAAFLRDNGWTDYYHPDSWVETKYFDDPTKDMTKMGCNIDVAYASVINELMENNIPQQVIDQKELLYMYGGYLLGMSNNDSNLNYYLKECLPTINITTPDHVDIVTKVLTEAHQRINDISDKEILSIDSFLG